MPILDPSLQIVLLQNCIEKSENSTPMYFFLTRLRIASRNINRNINTIETSIRFKTDLKDNIAFINKIFKCKITENDLKNPLIKNFYKLLYDNIELSSEEKKSAYLQGSYQICTDKYQTRFFKFTTFNKAFPHTWYLSDTPIAILCINSYIIDKSSFNFIKLEIDLMAAANYTVILCVNDIGQITDYLFDLILTNQFSEIHFNVSNSEMFELSLYKRIKNSLKENFETVKGYFYLYSPFSENLRRNKSKLSIFFQRFRVFFFRRFNF